MRVGDLVRLISTPTRGYNLPNAKFGIVKNFYPDQELVAIFWIKNRITFEFEDNLEVVNESR